MAHHPSNGCLATLHEGPLCPLGNEETPIIPPAYSPLFLSVSFSLSLSLSLALFCSVRSRSPLSSASSLCFTLFFFLVFRARTECAVTRAVKSIRVARTTPTAPTASPRNPLVGKVRLRDARVSWKRAVERRALRNAACRFAGTSHSESQHSSGSLYLVARASTWVTDRVARQFR